METSPSAAVSRRMLYQTLWSGAAKQNDATVAAFQPGREPPNDTFKPI